MFNEKYLKNVAPEKHEKFLLLKLRELQIVDIIDKITDRYERLPQLIRNSLKAVRKIFGCEAAAYLLADARKENNAGFYLVSGNEEGAGESLSETARTILTNYISEPLTLGIVNNPSESLKTKGIANYMLYPMVITSQLEGAFLVLNKPKPFSKLDLHFLKVVSGQLDNGIVHGRVLDELRIARKTLKAKDSELTALYEMSLSLNYGHDFEALVQKVLESATNLVNMDRASLMLYDNVSDSLKTSAVFGERQMIKLVNLGMGKGLAGLALLSRKTIVSTQGSSDERFIPFEFPGIKPRKIYTLICIPLLAGEKPLGILNFSILNKKKVFNPNDLEIIQAAGNLLSLALQRQQFYQLSVKDELTELATFRYFNERLQEELSRAKRYNTIFTLMMFDLDHFKIINDTYGHSFWNLVLKSFAQTLKDSLRANVDIPARFGGEEFAVILPHTDTRGALILAERIRKKVEALVLTFEKQTVKITVSVGLASFPEHASTSDALLKKADEALYNSKNSGRNRVSVADN